MKNANGFDVSTKNVMLDMWMNWLCLNIIAGVTAKLGKIHTTHNTVVESAGSAVVFSWFSPADDANILLTISVDENNHITWDIRQHDGEGDNLAKAEQGDWSSDVCSSDLTQSCFCGGIVQSPQKIKWPMCTAELVLLPAKSFVRSFMTSKRSLR